jgi:hypothetical protein
MQYGSDIQTTATSTDADIDKGETMINKLHILEQQAAHAQCLVLLVEFVTAVRGQKVCIMCGGRKARTCARLCSPPR